MNMPSAVNLVNGVFYPERLCDILDDQAVRNVDAIEDVRFDSCANVRLRLRRRLGRITVVTDEIDAMDKRDRELVQMTADTMCTMCMATAETVDEMFHAFYGTGDFEWVARIVSVMEATSCVSALLSAAWALHTFGRLGIVDLVTLRACQHKPAWVEVEHCDAMLDNEVNQ